MTEVGLDLIVFALSPGTERGKKSKYKVTVEWESDSSLPSINE